MSIDAPPDRPATAIGTSVEEAGVVETELQSGSLGLTAAIMQNVTHIAPAVAAFFFTPTIVGFAGGHSPLAYFIGFVIVLALGMCLVQLARLFPSAGGYFTYVSRTLHPRAGFLTGWAYTFYSPVVAGPLIAYFGFILQGELKANYSVDFPWWVFTLIVVPLISVLGYYGVKLSVRSIVIFGGLEFLIVLALGLSGLASPGHGGFTFRSFDPGFNPGGIATTTGFMLAIVFTVQGLTGWEAAVPLAEETKNPRRNVSIATMASIAITGVMLVVVIWGQVIGWGTATLGKLPTSSELPALVIAHRVWGGGWFVALLAMLSSTVAASLACQNVATRMWYGMARSGALPSAVATVHREHKTPTVAIAVQFVVSLALGLLGGALLGPDKMFILILGFCLVIAVIIVYSMGNIGVMFHYWRHRRGQFNWFFHLVFPLGTTAILIYSLIRSFTPFPTSPYNWSPVIIGVWMLLGAAILVALKIRGKEGWLAKAGDIIEERPDTADQLEEMHKV
jgi:amino acid transporter